MNEEVVYHGHLGTISISKHVMINMQVILRSRSGCMCLSKSGGRTCMLVQSCAIYVYSSTVKIRIRINIMEP